MIVNRGRLIAAFIGGMIYDIALFFIWSIHHVVGLIAGFFGGFFYTCLIIIIMDFTKDKIKRQKDYR